LAVEAEVSGDRRTRGISDSFNGPSAEQGLSFAHESGFVAVASFASVSKSAFPNGKGATLLFGGGYRWGGADAWHFGVGFAQELFPGAKVDAPSGLAPVLDPTTGEVVGLQPLGMTRTKFDTTYAVLEFGYGVLEGRYLNVVSRDYRGGNTSTICPLYLPDAAAALACYANGDFHTRGTQMLDLDLR